MTDFSWRIDDEDGDPELTGTPQPLVVTWRTVRAALRRTRRLWVTAFLLGGMLGVLALVAVPHPSSATTTLLLIHPNGDDPTAMTTDVSLLMTRAVANTVISDLGLDLSPEALHAAISVEPQTDQILKVTVTAPDDAAALARSSALIDTFLAFRGDQLRSISEGIVGGYQKRVDDLRSRVDTLTRQYAELTASRSTDQVAAGDILSQRSQLGSQISSMQQAIEDASLQTDAAISSTHVIDRPYVDGRLSKRTALLFGATGALALGSLTIAVVLFRALTSDRLRRRRDIADALGVPVRVGVGSLRVPGRAARGWRLVRAGILRVLAGLTRGRHGGTRRRDRSERNLEALVRGLETALPGQSARHGERRQHSQKARRTGPREAAGPATLALAAIDDSRTASRVLLALADRQLQQGRRVVLVDLTEDAALETVTRRPKGAQAPSLTARDDVGQTAAVRSPVVLRPPGDASLSRGPRSGSTRHSGLPDPLSDILRAEWDDADVALVLVEMDPGLDIENLTTWASRLVPLVSAGRASAELLRTVAGMVASARIDMPFALMEGADRSDETSGLAEPPAADAASARAELR